VRTVAIDRIKNKPGKYIVYPANQHGRRWNKRRSSLAAPSMHIIYRTSKLRALIAGADSRPEIEFTRPR
jgi:hypothetical protein